MPWADLEAEDRAVVAAVASPVVVDRSAASPVVVDRSAVSPAAVAAAGVSEAASAASDAGGRRHGRPWEAVRVAASGHF